MTPGLRVSSLLGCCGVVSPNEFWLCLHWLAEAYEGEGLTTEERTENIIAQLRDMPSVARRAVLADLVTVAAHIPDLYPVAIAAINQFETNEKSKPKRDVG